MAFANFATALRAWVQHFGWTGAPAALFGLVASEIRPDEARLDDAALDVPSPHLLHHSSKWPPFKHI